MGRKNKNKSGNRKQFWIENCPDSKNTTDNIAITVWITRVNLRDDHGLEVSDVPKMKDTAKTDESPLDSGTTLTDYAAASNQDDAATARTTQPSSMDDTTLPPQNQAFELKTCVTVDETTDLFCPPAKKQALDPAKDKHRTIQSSDVCIRRAASVSQTLPALQRFQERPNGDCGDGIVNPLANQGVADKYWAQRKRLFSKFDCGIQLDREGWFSVTPEAIANHIALRMTMQYSGGRESMVVLDAFAGVGGNSIAFARRPEVSRVICVDTDLDRLKMAAHNCFIYDIPKEKMLFIHDDTCTVLKAYANGELKAEAQKVTGDTANEATSEEQRYLFGTMQSLPCRLDAVFLSPPWGGPDYMQTHGYRGYSLESIKLNATTDGGDLLRMAKEALPSCNLNIAYFLPRNANGLKIGQRAIKLDFNGSIDLEQNYLNGKLKTVTAYFGLGKAPTVEYITTA
jgi:trimethylguanosine synthase